ncbi:hemagglutinin-like [Neofusicoccum parvum]|nr:hemagglutinin-like [Neofusicoccum parvum]
MHYSLLLISLASSVLGFALPKLNAQDLSHHYTRLKTKVITKHATTTAYVITGLPCKSNYDDAENDSIVTIFTTNINTATQTAFAIPTGLESRPFVGGNGGSSSIPNVTPVVVISGLSTVGTATVDTAYNCDSSDTPDTELLPDAECGFYFDEYLDYFYGYYDFSDASFPTALEDFAPGLSSYTEDDFGMDDLPQVVTVGGQEFNASSKISAPPDVAIQPRTPQAGGLTPQDFENIEEYLEAKAIQQNNEEIRRALEQNRAQGRPQTDSQIYNAFNLRLRAQVDRLRLAARQRREQADKAAQASQVVSATQASTAADKIRADAAAAQSKADAAAAAAATADSAKIAQVILDRKTLPVPPGRGPVQIDSKVEPLAVGKNVAEAAVGTFSNAPGKLKQIQDQAQSVVQNVQTASKPTGLAPRAVDSVSLSSATPTIDGDLNSAIAGLINSAGKQNSLDDPKTDEFRYSTISDLTGSYFLAADDFGTLSLTSEPPSADTFASKTFALFKGALANDARQRLVVFFPETMDALGVSRFRVAPLNETSFDAQAAAMIPVQVMVNGAASIQVLMPVDTEGTSYAFVACNIVANSMRMNKLFIAKNQDIGVRTLLDKTTRSEITGGVVQDCFPVALRL